MSWPEIISTEEQLEDVMTVPSDRLVEFMRALEGDIMVLGIGGKMGTTLGRVAVRACEAAGVRKRVIGASRFSDPQIPEKLKSVGMEVISCDLLDRSAVGHLPHIPNIIYMAGRKFGTSGDEELTWAMNALMPGNVGEHFTRGRIVAFSTGNVYPLVPSRSGGCPEDHPTGPIGEYAQSCLARERVFTYYSKKNRVPVAVIRLNYAIDLRYGVLSDVGQKVFRGEPVDVTMGHANVIWQGDANTQTLLALGHCAVPPAILNVAGPETVSIRYVAGQYGKLFGKTPVIQGTEGETALLSNSAKATRLFGYPRVSLQQMIEWTAHWIRIGGKSLGKPTHFEVRDGKF